MIEHQSYFQTATASSVILKGLVETASQAEYDSLFAAVAYATLRGSDLLNSQLAAEMTSWESVAKRWLISLDYGISDPSALVFLGNLPNSELRVPNARALLATNLLPRMSFHPKLYVFQQQATRAAGIFSGSANLTWSGLRINTEQATRINWTPPLSESEMNDQDEVLVAFQAAEDIYDDSEPLSDELLEEYKILRNSHAIFREDASPMVELLTQPKMVIPQEFGVAMAAANNFWIEINYVVENLGLGNPGNQIDMSRGSRTFFGFGIGEVEPNTSIGSVTVIFNEKAVECGIRFGNNQMDKMNLPAPGDHGPPTYVDQTLLFERLGGNQFILSLGTNEQINEWKARSGRQGTSYAMRSGRQFGVFD